MPTVINAHHYAPMSPKRPALPEPWIYIGRRHQTFGEASPLANPFTLKEHGTRALELYRRHLANLIREKDQAVMSALESIQDSSALVCFCKKADGSGSCHGDIVTSAWKYLKAQEQLQLDPGPLQEAGSGLIRPAQPAETPPPQKQPLENGPDQLQQLEKMLLREREDQIRERLEQELEERERENEDLELAAYYQAAPGPGPISPHMTAEAEAIAYHEKRQRERAAALALSSQTEADREAQWEINKRGLAQLQEALQRKRAQQLEQQRSTTRTSSPIFTGPPPALEAMVKLMHLRQQNPQPTRPANEPPSPAKATDPRRPIRG